MAKGNITGLSIDLGLDTRKVTEAAKAVKSDLSLMNSEMKKNMSAFDRSEKSVEKFSTRLGGLEKKLGIQERAVSSARSEYELMVKQYGEGSEQAKKAERNLNNQEASYNNLERATGNARKELEAYKKEQEIANSKWTVFGNKLDAGGQKLTKIGDGMQVAGGKLTKFSALAIGSVTGLGAGLFALTDKATEAADGIAKGAEKIGTSTDFYQEATYWASQNGLAQEDMEKAVGRLNQRMGLAVDGNKKYAGALEKLGVDLNGVKDGTVSTEDAMAQSLTTLSGMENQHEKAALAAELFGTKLSREMMPALNDGSLTMEEARKKAEELGLVMGQDQLEAAEAFQDAKDDIVRSAGAIGMKIGLDLMPHFQRLLDWVRSNMPMIREKIMTAFNAVVDSVKNLSNWWTELSGTSQKLILGFGALAISLGPVLLFVGKVASGIGGLMMVLGPLVTKVGAAGGMMKVLGTAFAAVTGPVGLTIAGIAALGAGFVIAYNKSETFRNFIDGLKGKFVGAWQKAIEFKDKVITAISGIKSFFTGDTMGGIKLLQSIGLSGETIEKVGVSVGKIRKSFFEMKFKINEALAGVKTFFISMFTDIKDWWDTDGTLIFSAIKTTISTALTFVVDLFNRFKPIVLGIWNAIFPVMHFIIKMVWEKIKLVVGIGMDVIQGIISGVSAIIEGDWERFGEIISETASSIWTRVVEFFTNMKENALTLFSELFSGAVQWFVDMYESLKERAEYIKTIVVYSFTALKDEAVARIAEMYESVKQWFVDLYENVSAKVTEIKDAVVLKFTELKDGVILKVTEMYNSVKQWFSDLWTNVTTKATEIKDSVTGSFTTLKDNAVERVTNMYNSVTGWFGDMKTNTVNKATTMKDDVVNRFTTMRDNSNERTREMFSWVTGKFGELSTWMGNKATGMKDDVVQAFTWMKDGAVEGVQTLYDRTSTLFDNVKNYASDTFGDMVDGAKALPGKIGDAIKGMAHKAVEGISSLGKSMGDKMSGVVNGVVGGLNKVLSAIGVSEIPTISINTGGGGSGGSSSRGHAPSVARFSTGTRNGAIASDMFGMVNDIGPGNGRGGATQELIKRGGQLFAPRGRNAIVPLKKGDEIFNGAQTQSLMSSGAIPRFSQGTGTEGGDSGKKGLLGTLSDVVKNVFSYITDPGKAFDTLMSSVSANFEGFDGFAGKMLSGGFKMVTDGIKNFIAKIFKENEGALGSGKGGKWMNYRMTTPYSPNSAVPGYPTSFNGGRHYGIDYGTPMGTPITATTGGQLSSFWNEGGGKIAKLVTGQLRQFFMHMQSVGPNGSVKAGDVIGKSGNSGRWTTGPHVHWQAQQGADSLNRNTIDPRKVLSNHRKGGILQREGMFWGAEGNKEEVVIPLHRPSEAMKLMNYVASKMGGGSKQTSSVPNVSQGNDNNEIVNALVEQNGILMKMLEKLTGIEAKELIVGENEIGSAADRYNNRYASKRSVKTGRLNYNV